MSDPDQAERNWGGYTVGFDINLYFCLMKKLVKRNFFPVAEGTVLNQTEFLAFLPESLS